MTQEHQNLYYKVVEGRSLSERDKELMRNFITNSNEINQRTKETL
uniref:Uncharacterized protein n=1 Tax=Dulem virus 42 TaxID=3145760 RepID=A0AAU8BB13_9CAUD